MRPLSLLAALLLLAFQAQAQKADQVPAQDEPEVQDQDQPGDEDQDVAISFTGEDRFARRARGLQRASKEVCYCRTRCRLTIFSKFSERPSGKCKVHGRRFKLCCK